jgi:hypothetical protein
MTDQNGWPDASKPGYPLNPDRDGWHWVDRPMHGVLPMQWLEIAGGGWVGKHTCLTALEATKAGWRYVGPCLTPAEVAARIEAAYREGYEDGYDAGENDATCAAQGITNPDSKSQDQSWQDSAAAITTGLPLPRMEDKTND